MLVQCFYCITAAGILHTLKCLISYRKLIGYSIKVEFVGFVRSVTCALSSVLNMKGQKPLQCGSHKARQKGEPIRKEAPMC